MDNILNIDRLRVSFMPLYIQVAINNRITPKIDVILSNSKSY